MRPKASEPRYNVRCLLLTLALSGLAIFAGQLMAPWGAIAERRGGFAYSIELTGAIDRSAQFGLERALAEARERRASVVIVRLDTPGGLVQDAREMTKDIIAAPMPVIVYVHPGGAHAESAGLFLTLAGDVAAMTPGTNIGSATPFLTARPQNEDQRALVKLLERKARNDAIAWSRALAEQHGRNADLAERMVSEAVNVSAGRAKGERLIDIVATSEPALLRMLDGFRLKGPKARELRTAGLRVEHAKVDTGLADSGESGDESSFIRSFALVLVVVLGIGIGLWMLVRGQRWWRRQRRLWRRWRAKRRRRKLDRR